MNNEIEYDFVNDKSAYTDLLEVVSPLYCQKKPVTHGYFISLDEIKFVTSSGTQTAKPGDYVIIGKDHAWPVSKDYFEENYNRIEK